MLQSLAIKLETSESHKVRLLDIMERYNEACNFVADEGFFSRVFNQFKLHKLVYRFLREHFGLKSQMAVRVIGKVAECFKRDKTIQPVFRKYGAIQYDQRNCELSLDKVSLTTAGKRLHLKTIPGEFQKQRWSLGNISGQCDIIYENKKFYVVVTQEVTNATKSRPSGFLGVDLGVNNIAVDSDREIFTSDKTEAVRERYSRQRAELQKKGSKSAKRKLMKKSGREERFKKDTNHCISKYEFLKAKGTNRAIVFEDLEGIRSRTTVSKGQRDRHSKWAFRQLKDFSIYKAERGGVGTILIGAYNTSRECPRCHYVDKANRNENIFKCLNCGYTEISDYVAATNIAARVAVNRPIVAHFFRSYKPVVKALVVSGHRSLTGGS